MIDKKVILKVSNAEDDIGILGIQTDAILYCHANGCKVQKIFSSNNAENTYLVPIKMEGKSYHSRLFEFIEGTLINAYMETKDIEGANLRKRCWYESGRTMGKVT